MLSKYHPGYHDGPRLMPFEPSWKVGELYKIHIHSSQVFIEEFPHRLKNGKQLYKIPDLQLVKVREVSIFEDLKNPEEKWAIRQRGQLLLERYWNFEVIAEVRKMSGRMASFAAYAYHTLDGAVPFAVAPEHLVTELEEYIQCLPSLEIGHHGRQFTFESYYPPFIKKWKTLTDENVAYDGDVVRYI